MNTEKLKDLQINPAEKRRPQRAFWSIVIVVAVVLLATVLFIQPWAKDKREIVNSDAVSTNNSLTTNVTASKPVAETAPQKNSAVAADNGSVLTVSGYIINRERIEISPRFLGVVKWIGVKKGDAVTNGQVVVLLDDAEYKARLNEAEGHVANMKVSVAKAELDYERIHQLASTKIE